MPKLGQTSSNDKPPYVKLFELLGCSFRSPNGKEVQADQCPFCGGAKFSLNSETGQYQCFSKNSCGKVGNAYTFIDEYHKRCLAEASDEQYHALRDRRGFGILPEYEFSDEAISGTKRKREGLDRLLAAAERREFRVLYFHSLSRLARESVIGMPILKTLVHNYGVRVISVSEGVDSNMPGWETVATFICLHHEQFIRDLAANVFKGQEGTVLSNFSVGDYRIGYESVPSPNGEMVGRGRNAKPRMVYRVHSEQADIVRQVYHWFVHEKQWIAWIVRELNRLRVPKDHRASTPDWERSCVIRMLRSEKYVGLWWWGLTKTNRDPTTGDSVVGCWWGCSRCRKTSCGMRSASLIRTTVSTTKRRCD
jgi:hypothetical protein